MNRSLSLARVLVALLALAAGTLAIPPGADGAPDQTGTLTGRVTDGDAGAPGVEIDLFEAMADGSRGTFLAKATTDTDGRFRHETTAGCYVLTFIAPDGRTFTGGRQWHQPSACVQAGETISGLDIALEGAGPGATVGGTVTQADGGVAGVVVDLFTAQADGSRGVWLGDATTDGDGRYQHPVSAGCYVLTFIAPDGETFSNGSRWYQPAVCVEAGGSSTVDATLAGGTPPPPDPAPEPDIHWGFEDDSYRDITTYDRPASNGCFGGRDPFDLLYGRNICVATNADAPAVMRNERSTTEVRAGQYSYYAYLHPSDPDDWPTSEATHRSEITPRHNNPFGWDPTLDFDADGAPLHRWYGFSTLIPEGETLAGPDEAEITRYSFVQWQHGTPGSPAVSILVRGDRYFLYRHWGTAPDGLRSERFDLGPVVTGEWVDWVVHIGWHHDRGTIEVWADGELVASLSDVQTVHSNISNTSRMKLGLYYWQWKNRRAVEVALANGLVPREVYIDEVRLYEGDDRGYERVAPR